MIGYIVNALAIIAGSIIGVFFNKSIPKNIKHIVMQALGLCVLIIGLSMALKVNKILIMIFSIVLGSIIGELLNVESRLESVGKWLKLRFKSKDKDFAQGFVSSSLIFCIGAMAIVGSIQDGLYGDVSIIYAKSIIDGIACIAFASVFGIGVAFSAIPVFLYQGGITLLANSANSFLIPSVVNEISAVGGLIIVGIGLNMLELTKIRLANMLPSMVVVIILSIIFL